MKLKLINRISSKNNDLNSSIKDNNSKNHHKSKNWDAIRQNNHFKEYSDKLKSENNILNESISKVKEENIRLSSEISTLKNQNNKLEENINYLNNTNDDLFSICSSLKKENGELSQNLDFLREENGELSQNLDFLKKEKDVLSKNVSSLKNKNKISNEEKKKNKLKFINFQEFLARSYVAPVIETPFKNEDKRVFAFMDYLGKYLRSIVSDSNYHPLVSIIMPTFNRKNIISNAINSILNQTYSNFELIIVDDGSTDKTVELLNSFNDDRIKLLVNKKNMGCSFSRNYGLNESKGEIIMYLDSDNEWDSKYIETMVGAFIILPEADALYSGQLLYKNFNSKPYAMRFGSFNKSLLHNRNYIDLNCFCHKRDILTKIKGFDEKLLKLIDWDFILRISKYFKIYSVPVILSKYYNHSGKERITNMPLKYWEVAEKILDKNKITPKKFKPLSKKVSIIIPSYESLNEIKNCINSILSNEFEKMVDIIVVDNNSSEDVRRYLLKLESEGKISLILNSVNYGFTYSVKQGIALSKFDSDILLLNNDAILTKGALEHMQNCAYTLPECGLIVPHEMSIKGHKAIPAHVPHATSKFECDTTPSIIHQNIINMPVFHDGGLLELNFAPFFCTYIKRSVYNKTLGLDAELGRHYRSDRIFSDFVRHVLQLKIYQAPDAYVYHKHKVATKILKKDKKEEYKYIFIKNQWGPELAKQLGYENALWDF